MEESTVTKNIRQGKKDWETVQKRLLKEETDQMGGSDVSANQPLGSGEKPETMQKVAQSVSQAGDTPEFKNLKKDLLLGITKAKKDQVIKLARTFKNADTASMSLEDFISTITDMRDELVAEKEKLNPALADNIQKYNTIVDTALTHSLGSMGLAVERMKLPMVKNIDDFRNVAVFFGDYDNIIQDVVSHVKQITSKNILGTPLLDEAFTGKRNVQKVDDTLSSLAKVKDRIPNKFSNTIHQSGLIKHLTNAFLITAKHEVLDALIQGFNQKIQKLNASKSSRDAAQAKRDAELIVLDPNDFGVDPHSMVEPVDENAVVPTTKQGPGKIYDVNQQLQESKEDSQDISNARKNLLTEGWNKMSDRSIKNSKNAKPDDFTLLIG